MPRSGRAPRRLAGPVALLLLACWATGAAAEKGGGAAVLPGGNAKQPINIEAVKLDYFDKEQKLIYTGNVVATQGDAKMKASVLTILLAPKGSKGEGGKGAGGEASGSANNQVQRMLAAGPVTLLQRDQVGTGDSGVYDKAAGTVVLTGNVTLSQGPNVTKGDKLTYDLKTGQAVVTGRVKSMFQPEDRNAAAAEEEGSPRHTARKGAGAATGSRGL